MKLIKVRPYNFVNWLWVSDYYDMNLSGLCIYHRKICWFEAVDPSNENNCTDINIYSLTRMEKFKALLQKKLFEVFVGYHWTYPNRVDGDRVCGNGRISKFYYKYLSKRFLNIK